ncbi:MAG: glutaredoxin family protein [Moraxellaceae bacterium]|nr:glutaredoxin family protein [Moraxellaceae bacterium]
MGRLLQRTLSLASSPRRLLIRLPEASFRAGWLQGLLLTLLLNTTAHADIYKWVDAEGKVHFSDKKPRDGKANKVDLPPINTIQQVTVRRPQPGTAASPAADGEIVMYSATWCGVCTTARRYFERNGVRFSEYDVETTEKGRRDYAIHKGRGVPLIFVGAARMEGFSEGRFRQMQAGR